MKAIITKTNRSNRRGRSVVYISSPLDKVADDFASKHGIYNLQFKCKTWNKVCREVTKRTAETLKELFVEATAITFSSKAGCSCGCSPGYIIKHESPYKAGDDVWVDIEASDHEVDAFSSMINAGKFESQLRAEVCTHELVK